MCTTVHVSACQCVCLCYCSTNQTDTLFCCSAAAVHCGWYAVQEQSYTADTQKVYCTPTALPQGGMVSRDNHSYQSYTQKKRVSKRHPYFIHSSCRFLVRRGQGVSQDLNTLGEGLRPLLDGTRTH